jgi:hypothetical protein
VHDVPVAEQAVAAPPPAGTVYPYKANVQFVADVWFAGVQPVLLTQVAVVPEPIKE